MSRDTAMKRGSEHLSCSYTHLSFQRASTMYFAYSPTLLLSYYYIYYFYYPYSYSPTRTPT